MDASLKRQIVNAAESIKKKVKRIRDVETDSNNALEMVFKPLTGPLNQIVDKQNIQGNKNDHELFYKSKVETKSFDNADEDYQILKNNTANNEKFESDNGDHNEFFDLTYKEQQNDKEVNSEDRNSVKSVSPNNSVTDDESFRSLSEEEVSSWSKSSESLNDVPFGVRIQNGKLMLGSAIINVTDKKISVAGRNYVNTKGLHELLFKKSPNSALITDEDRKNYKTMLIDTNVHRRDFDPSKPIKSNKGQKYLEFIKPLFKEVTIQTGDGIPMLKKWRKNVDFIYWDDPNELVERLKLLVASRDAGNTGLDNEIISIIEELQENEYL